MDSCVHLRKLLFSIHAFNIIIQSIRIVDDVRICSVRSRSNIIVSVSCELSALVFESDSYNVISLHTTVSYNIMSSNTSKSECVHYIPCSLRSNHSSGSCKIHVLTKINTGRLSTICGFHILPSFRARSNLLRSTWPPSVQRHSMKSKLPVEVVSDLRLADCTSRML